jgi:hypothetical protein
MVAVTWAIFGYGCLALVLATWAAYGLTEQIRKSKQRKAKGKGRHRG